MKKAGRLRDTSPFAPSQNLGQPIAPQEHHMLQARRILILPRKECQRRTCNSGGLDVGGRLDYRRDVGVPNGDSCKTMQTDRAMFVEPLNAEKIYGAIKGRRYGTASRDDCGC